MSAKRKGTATSALVAALAALVAVPLLAEKPPKGYQQILPRGRIASVDEPRFVSAAKARIPADAWVFGVVIEGQARAYSLNLLNRHEVVNDRVGGTSFAAVW
jgi:hypothetical protein